MADLGFESTTDDVLDGVDLTGRVAAVTGASGGLGLETARALAARGARVVMAARDSTKLRTAVEQVATALPGADLVPLELDLTDVASCRRAAVELLSGEERLDLLINNAGVMCTPFGRTIDGFELQFGTNHLGHMAWTLLLLDVLARSAAPGSPSRIVNLSSAGHKFGDVDLDDPNYENRSYDPWEAYGRSKTANVLFSVALDARLAGVGVRSSAVHPGGIHTDLGRHMTPETLARLAEVVASSQAESGFRWKTVPQGAATTVWAATAPELADRGGIYCEDCHVADVDDGNELNAGGVRSYAIDPQRAEALWERSMALLGEV